MAGTIYKLDRSGHGEVAAWGDDAESRAAGAKAFAGLAERGFTMFDGSRQDQPKLDAFDPDVADIIAVPRLVAG